MSNYRHKKVRKSLNLSEEDHAKYVKEAQRLHAQNITMGEMAGYFMDLHLKYDFYDPEWRDKMIEALNQIDGNKFVSLDGACSSFQFSKTEYMCIKGEEGKQPRVKKLGKTLDTASAICRGCKKTIADAQKEKEARARETDEWNARREASWKEHGYSYQGVRFWLDENGHFVTEKPIKVT